MSSVGPATDNIIWSPWKNICQLFHSAYDDTGASNQEVRKGLAFQGVWAEESRSGIPLTWSVVSSRSADGRQQQHRRHQGAADKTFIK